MSESSSFFIPRRIKQKATSELKVAPKRAKYHHGVLIFDEEEERHKEAKLEAVPGDLGFSFAENSEALERKRTNGMVSAFWACHLYLEPVNVMHLTLYWLSEYVNYKLPESEWFSDHIRQLINSPIRFELTSSQGIAYVHTNLSKYSLLMYVCGSPLHQIPSEYFVHQDAVEMLECLCHFLEPSNQCFLVKNTFSLKAELELAAFQYNRILSYFYEPSFLIITSYLVYLHYLLSMPQYNTLSHFLPQIKHIMKPISPERIKHESLLSLNRENTNYEEKKQVFLQDLADLYNALAHLDIETVKNQVISLWSKKASYATDQIYLRLTEIRGQLYPD